MIWPNIRLHINVLCSTFHAPSGSLIKAQITHTHAHTHWHKLVKQLRVRWNWSCDHELSNSGSVAIKFSIDLHSQNWNERKSEYSPPPPASPAPVNLLMSYLRSQKSEGLFTEDERNWNTDLTNGSLVLPGSLPIRIQYFGEIHFTEKLQITHRWDIVSRLSIG